MRVINKWEDVSILKYQQLVETLKIETELNIDKEILLLSLFSDISVSEIKSKTYEEFINSLNELKFLGYPINNEEIKKVIKIKDKEFKINTKVEKMTTEEYIDLMELTKTDIIENLHKIVAVVTKCDDFDTFNDKAEWIQDNMSIVTGNSIMVFFYTYLTNSIITSLETQNLMLKMLKKITWKKEKRDKLKAFSEYLETYISLIGYQK